MRPLTTTSYTILGQLALRPWTAYELTGEMRRNVHYFWPRAESGLYAEIKRLAASGLAKAQLGRTGKRRRTTYAITAKGKQALDAWMATPPNPPLLEAEVLVRLLLAPTAAPADTLGALEATHADMQRMIDGADVIRREYLDGRAPFQEHAETRALVFDFLWAYAHMVHAWAARSREHLERSAMLSKRERLASTREIFARAEPTARQPEKPRRTERPSAKTRA